VKLIIQPDDGIAPLLVAIKKAKKTIDIVIFRFDRMELEKALAAAVGRGVVVRALVAHTNRGGEKRLRKLEMSFLQSGVAVCRTADDLTRHHGKMMIVDGELYVIGFNFTELDINRSRSFGIVTREPSLVKAASALFQADSTRQPYDATHKHLVISPEPRESCSPTSSRAPKRNC
jgi:phosphatidylserine/phosphatidylglycerophosphate/cardiolipin synthase-like enzyme